MTRRSRIAVAVPAIILLLLSTPVVVRQSAALEPTDQEKATKQEQFELVHRSLVRLSQDYVNDVLKTIAFLLLAVGWILTSDRSREFLKNNRAARRAALIIVPVIALLNFGWSIAMFLDSQVKMGLLKNDIKYVPPDYYADDGIASFVFGLNLLVHLALFLTLFALIHSLSRADR